MELESCGINQSKLSFRVSELLNIYIWLVTWYCFSKSTHHWFEQQSLLSIIWRMPHSIRRHILGPNQLNLANRIENLSIRVDFLKSLLRPIEYINTLSQQRKWCVYDAIIELYQPSLRYVKKSLRLAMDLVSVKLSPYFTLSLEHQSWRKSLENPNDIMKWSKNKRILP